MAFPGSGSTSLATTWANLQGAAGRVKDRSAFLSAQSTLTRRHVLEHQNYLLDIRGQMEVFAAAPGIQPYAQNEINDPSLNLATEYVAMRNAIDTLLAWGVTNFPNTSGELRVYTFASQRVTDINLTGGELSAYKTQLNNLIATIS
jgi:hypothetical protein